LLFQNITMCANLISIPRTPVVKEWVEIIEFKKVKSFFMQVRK